MLVMDLPLWEPSDDQGHVMPFDGGDYVGDSWLFDNYSGYGEVDMRTSFCFGDSWLTDLYYGRDVIEEDALNEKYCVQVLQILMDKTDKEIVKLEEEIVMLQCQLAWDDDEWSKLCSAALREKIDHLDDLARSLKIENKEDMHCFDDELEQLEKVPPRIHDLLKPLLENYSWAKVAQTKSSFTQMPVLSAASINEKNLEAMISDHDKKLVEKECINMQENDERKNLHLESEDEKTNDSKQTKDATILKCISDAHKCAYYKLSEHDLNNLNRLQKKRVPISAPAKSGWTSSGKLELSNPVIKNSSTSASIDEGSSKERSNSSNSEEVFPLVKNSQCSPQEESTVTNSHFESQETEGIIKAVKPADVSLDTRLQCGKQVAEASSQTQKARTNQCVINENVLFTKPLVSLKRKRTKSTERTEELKSRSIEMTDTNSDSLGLLNGMTKCTGKSKINVDTIIKQQRIPEMKNPVSDHAEPICPVKCEGQGPEEKYLATSDVVVQLYLEKEADTGSSSTRKLKGLQRKKFTKSSNINIEPESGLAEIEVESEDPVVLIPSSQKKRKKTSLSLANITVKKGARNFLVKMEQTEDDTPTDNCAMKDLKGGGTLSLNDLKAMAKKQKLRGYHKLRKADLQQLLGLNPEAMHM